MTASDIDRALTQAFRNVRGWCPLRDDPPAEARSSRVWARVTSDATAERRKRVRRLHNLGLLGKQIAIDLGVSEQIVSRDLDRIGAPRNPHGRPPSAEVAERRKRVAELYAAGSKPKAIAAELRVPYFTVANDLRLLGIRRKSPRQQGTAPQ